MISPALFSLESAIDRRPLTVRPGTSLKETIAIMGKAQSSCVLPHLIPLNSILTGEARASGILVVEGSQLLGIFTGHQAIQAIVSGRNLIEVKIAEVMKPPAIALSESESQDIFSTLSLLRQHQIRHLPIVDDQRQLVGMVTPESICQVLQLDELLKSRQLSEVMTPPVIHASMTTSALSLAQLMAKQQVNGVVLMQANAGDDRQPVGLITQRDIIQLQALELDLSQMQAQAVMTTPLLCFDPSKSVLAAFWEMQQQRVQRSVVSETNGELLGMITPTSFLDTLDLAEMYRAVEQLQQSVSQFEAEKLQFSQTSNPSLEPQGRESQAELLEQLECNRLLNAMALRIRESLNLDEMLNTTVAEVRQFLQTDRVIIYRFNPDLSGTVVVESIAPGWQPALNSTLRDTCFGQNYAQRYQEGRIQVTEDIYTAGLTQCHIDILVLYDIRASLVVPILQDAHLWGLLCAYHCSGPRRWRQLEIDLLKQLATHMAIAIQQSELYQQLQAELVERQRAEEQIKASLKEKEVLLKEIHHRVKNNLQIISSLLKLQSSYIKDKQALEMFKDSQSRIRSMALIHEKLYQSQNLSKINFAEYIHDLTMHLLRSYSTNSQQIHLRLTNNEIWLSIDTAVPCGLIINELVSNSLKHAFPIANQEGEIHVDLYASPDHKFTLIVSDNGIGFPQALDFQNTESLGLELVCTLTEQLEGTIELDDRRGTTFKIMFAESEGLEKV
jgi:two-component sensor histidine kinase/CBS domain-containing protein